MKGSRYEGLALGRDARLASVAALLVALGAIGFAVGWNVSGALVLVAAIGLVAAYFALVVRPAKIPHEAALTFRITGGLREDPPRSPLEQLRSRGVPTLFHLRRALEAAAGDPAVRSIVAEIAAPGLGLATAQELRDLLRANVAAGKRVVAVLSADSVTLHDYLVASGAGEIVVNPDSVLMMVGVAAGSFFVKDALEKLKVEAQILQWKEYKGAAEIFSRQTMSPELRESLEAIIHDSISIITENVAAARGLDLARTRDLIGGGFMSARAAREAGLIDRVGYLEDLRNELEPDQAPERFVGLARYLRHADYMRDRIRRPRLALIHGVGPVIAGESPGAGDFISGEQTAAEIRRAAKDPHIRAIVFRVNSPGGSAVGSDLVWRAVCEARQHGTPVVVSMGDVAGSGGYYVAMGADAIVAEPSTITGSIGVVYTKFNLGNLLATIGVGIELAKSDRMSDALSPSRAMTGDELAQLNQVVGELYGNFTAKVAEGRKLAADHTERVARGRVWSGLAAKGHGLVDELGGLGRAVAIAREKAGLAPHQAHDLVLYPAPNLLARFNLTLARSEIPFPTAMVSRAIGMPERWAPALMKLLGRGGAFLLCPFF